MTESIEKAFSRLASSANDPQSPARVLYRCERFFRDVSPADKAILEIGAGNGVLSAYALSRGAKRVVALEPEAAGSTAGVSMLVQKLTREFPGERFTFLPDTLQQFSPGDRTFDMVLLHDSINHLDEPACEIAHRSAAARESYVRLFQKIADLLSPGGQVVLCDCSRYNFFDQIGLRNPIVPFIEWRKHQSPRFWARLLREANLRTRRVDWYPFYRLRSLGRLAENPAAAFFLTSKFRLIARKKPRDQ
ncbi:MAG: class I SAM-dependent methyltransferase [Phycisphaerae bacterium]|nr:class I SAM-dependent methyltransferase [Phycisphaerae bacterium]